MNHIKKASLAFLLILTICSVTGQFFKTDAKFPTQLLNVAHKSKLMVGDSSFNPYGNGQLLVKRTNHGGHGSSCIYAENTEASVLKAGYRIVSKGLYTDTLVVEPLVGSSLQEQIKELGQLDGVEYVEPNYTYRASVPLSDEKLYQIKDMLEPYAMVRVDGPLIVSAPVKAQRGSHSKFEPNDPLYKYQWHMNKVYADEGWEVGDRGKGAVVAVIDTGVAYEDYGQFKLARDLKGQAFTKPYNFVDRNEHANDDHGHGTHVAGTIAQATNNNEGVTGVAFNSTIMPLKVLSAMGSGSTQDIADAIRYAADNGANVINMSLGGPFPSRVMGEACKYAYEKGVTIICAAGNESSDDVGYPAGYDECIAVSATDTNDELSWYSNYGAKVEIAAPGGDTRVDKNGDGYKDGVLQNTINPRNVSEDVYALFQGTSMASPHAAGVAALIVGCGVANPAEVREVLKASARPVGSGVGDPRFGAGIVDAYSAQEMSQGHYKKFRYVVFVVAFLILGFALFELNRRYGWSNLVAWSSAVGAAWLAQFNSFFSADIAIFPALVLFFGSKYKICRMVSFSWAISTLAQSTYVCSSPYTVLSVFGATGHIVNGLAASIIAYLALRKDILCQGK